MCSISQHTSSSPSVFGAAIKSAAVPQYSEDPSYYKQYLQDVHTIFIRELQLFEEAKGESTSPRIYTPIDPLLFNSRLFLRIEQIRERALPEGFGRGPSSHTQQRFNRMAFDVIREIVAKTNDSTSLQYVPGEVPALGFKRERLAISSVNFIPRVQPELLPILFPATTLGWRGCQSVKQSVDQLAADAFLQELQQDELNEKRVPKDPVFLAAALPWVSVYLDESSLLKSPGLDPWQAREFRESRLHEIESDACNAISIAITGHRESASAQLPHEDSLPSEVNVKLGQAKAKDLEMPIPAAQIEMPLDASPATAGSESTEPGNISDDTVDRSLGFASRFCSLCIMR